MERALRACMMALRLGRIIRYEETQLADIYYVTLLRFAGCAADARHRSAYFDDEIALGPQIDAVELWKAESMLPFLQQHVGTQLPPAQRAQKLDWALATGVQRSVEAAVANCEIAQSIAKRLGLPSSVDKALGDVFERWDGAGVPGRASGDGIALAARVATLALDAELFLRLGGPNALLQMAQQRRGGQYDPALVEGLCAHVADICQPVNSLWEQVLAQEPAVQQQRYLDAQQFAEVVRAIADFNDLRTPWMAGHSTAVGELSYAAALHYGLPEAEASALRHAGYTHDVGMLAVSVSVWDKPDALTESEWDRVRLHPYYTERVLARSAALAPIGTLAALHHECLDGSGYFRQLPAAMQSPAVRILASAELYRNKIEARPYRPAYSVDEATAILQQAVRAKRLDGDAVSAVLAAAGHHPPSPPRGYPAGLSEREVEVLRLLAKDLTNKQIAERLVISPATVDHHLRHIYTKIGCSTRMAATLFAMSQRLVDSIA